MKSDKCAQVWVDGCFDMVHFGHANLIRQAKALSHRLIVGIHSDDEITRNKGPPVFTQDERYTLLKAIKWVDEIVKDAPYMTQLDVLEEYNCDFCVHGDDISVAANGVDAYSYVKEAGKYVEVSRTEGISTTDIIYRILKAIKSADSQLLDNENELNSEPASNPSSSYTCGITHYIPNTLRIMQFMSPGRCEEEGMRPPRPGDTVVYTAGAFDLFHVGHVQFLERCHDLGSYLIVGLHSDETAAREQGRIGPILNMHERLLFLLACKYVNNVILEAPYEVTDKLIDFFKVDFVVTGKHTEGVPLSPNDPMAVAKRRGILRQVDSQSDMTTRKVIRRIIDNHDYHRRNQIKESKESAMIALGSLD